MAKHPYIDLPDRQFWKRDPGLANLGQFDPVSEGSFKVAKTDRIVTAGSCFAQHVARHLSMSGFNHHIVEKAHPLVTPEIAQAHNYGLFSARYGNVYTARQLLQLVQRAFGTFVPKTAVWEAPSKDRWVDPFRPNIEPDGYATVEDLEADRAYHLDCTRRAFETMDVFVFTLGLTEGWADKADGAVWPLAPGVSGGHYDEAAVTFENFDVSQTTQDLRAALDLLRSHNPDVRIILTVSPVPLNATFVPRHCAVSTVWSKSVLRVAAQTLADTLEQCDYFPSYEVITSPHARGQFYAKDGREVTDKGVSHVMSLFFRHYTDAKTPAVPKVNPKLVKGLKRGLRSVYTRLPYAVQDKIADIRQRGAPAAHTHTQEMEKTMQVLCDEEKIDNKK